VSLLFLVLYCLCTGTPHCVRTYVSLPSHATCSNSSARLRLSIRGVAPAGVAPQNSDHTYISHLHTKYYLMARDTSTYTYAVASEGSRVGTFTYSVSLLRLTFQQKVLLRSTNVYIVYYCYTEQSHSDMTTSDAGVFC